MSETLIKAEHVSKKFCRDLKTSLWYGMKDITGELMGKEKKNQTLRDKEFWSVDDISFEVKRGECLGLIGRNGAGKSTLLKMLNGLIKPDRGRIEMHGRVGALIELGAGFNPILTGRENIFNNAAILGFTRSETRNKLDSIIEFSELSDFIDTPVQNYSSGMKIRLGFAIATHMEPDILLLDEVLAVGDMGFTLKCYNKMDELLQKTAMVFVSHSMPQISRMCSQVMVLKAGKIETSSNDVSIAINKYYDQYNFEKGIVFKTEDAELESIFISSNGVKSSQSELFEMNTEDSFQVHLTIKLHKPIASPTLFLNFLDKEQKAFATVGNFKDYFKLERAENKIHVVAKFNSIRLTQGIYSIQVGLMTFENNLRRNLFRNQSAIYFKIKSSNPGWVPIQFVPEWEIIQ